MDELQKIVSNENGKLPIVERTMRQEKETPETLFCLQHHCFGDLSLKTFF